MTGAAVTSRFNRGRILLQDNSVDIGKMSEVTSHTFAIFYSWGSAHAKGQEMTQVMNIRGQGLMGTLLETVLQWLSKKVKLNEHKLSKNLSLSGETRERTAEFYNCGSEAQKGYLSCLGYAVSNKARMKIQISALSTRQW